MQTTRENVLRPVYASIGKDRQYFRGTASRFRRFRILESRLTIPASLLARLGLDLGVMKDSWLECRFRFRHVATI